MFLSNISSIFKMGILNYLFWCQTYAAINNILCFFFIFHSDVIFYYSFVFFITHIALVTFIHLLSAPYIYQLSPWEQRTPRVYALG